MKTTFSFLGNADNPSSMMMMIGALFILTGWGSSTIGVDGSFLVGLGILFVFIGVLLNVLWNRKR